MTFFIDTCVHQFQVERRLWNTFANFRGFIASDSWILRNFYYETFLSGRFAFSIQGVALICSAVKVSLKNVTFRWLDTPVTML